MAQASVIDDRELLEITPEEMENSYIEYRRACYHALYRHSLDRGLIERLRKPTTLTDVSAAMNFSPNQRPTLERLIAALVRYGVVKQDDNASNGEPAYVATTTETGPPDIDTALVSRATGAESLSDLLHGNSYPGIIDSLFSNENKVASAFIGTNLPVWDEFLSTPFYRYNRVKAADRICAPGKQVADIACGPGFGLRECASMVTGTGSVHGIEISHDFAAAAIERNTDIDNVTVTRTNVDGDGLAFLNEDCLDGAMMVGAFHFLEDQPRFLTHMRRALRPGSPLCLAYVYMKRGSYDQELTDIRFHLRSPRPHPVSAAELVATVTDAGFTQDSTYTMGCYQSFVFLA